MHLTEAQQTVDHWIKQIGVRYFNELTNMAILTEETGEVARLIARIYGEQSFKNPTSAEQAKTMLADELADVLFVLICIANQTGVDLEQAFAENIKKKTNRDSQRHQENQKLQ